MIKIRKGQGCAGRGPSAAHREDKQLTPLNAPELIDATLLLGN